MGHSIIDIHGKSNQPDLSILVTDSGLGGLSICADMAARLVASQQFRNLSVVYFNAWPLQDKGYNFLEDDAARIRIFGNAIRSMNRYSPDLIFIACNTLSVIFQQAQLAAVSRAPVVDIIDCGIDRIVTALAGDPVSPLLLLGTRTTIASGVHARRLLERGVDRSRIARQDCHGLAGAIERDPQSPRVRSLVEQFMARAAAVLPPAAEQIYAVLCCTHYGYSQVLIKESLSRHTGARVAIINPNQAMSDFISVESLPARFQSVNLNVDVVSRVPLSARKISAIAALIEPVSPQTALALKNYRHIPDLFDIG